MIEESNENSDVSAIVSLKADSISFDFTPSKIDEAYDNSEDFENLSVDTPTYARNRNGSVCDKPGQPVPASVPSELLLRLFESNFFSIGMAIQYLFESKNKGVLEYLKNRIQTFPDSEVDFYLPQIVTLWNTSPELQDTLEIYLMSRCKRSIDFAINISWLLETFDDKSSDILVLSKSANDVRLNSLKRKESENKIEENEIIAQGSLKYSASEYRLDEKYNLDSQSKIIACDDQGSSSNQSIFLNGENLEEEISDENSLNSGMDFTMDNQSCDQEREKCSLCCLRIGNFLSTQQQQQPPNHAKSQGNSSDKSQSPNSSHSYCNCKCHDTCSVQSMWDNTLIRNQFEFMNNLFLIGRHLTKYSSKDQRTSHLLAELAMLNLKLPARVWLPVTKENHIVLRIPPNSAVCLNSKDRAPYLVFVEILECKSPQTIEIPSKSQLSSCATSISSLNDIDFLSRLPNGLKQKSRLYPDRLSSFFGSIRPKNSTTSDKSELLHCASSEDFTKLQAIGSATAIAAPDSVSVISTESSTDDIFNFYQDQLQTMTHQLNSDNMKFPSCRNINGKSNGFIYEKPAFISASDVRQKLTKYADHSYPKKSFKSDPEDPSAEVLKEPWSRKCCRIREKSPWGHLSNWKLIAAIVKVGDDLRQEQLAYQLLRKLQLIWIEENVDLWLRPLEIIVFGSESGLIEPVPDTVSFHQIKRHAKISLLDYMIREHGSMNSKTFIEARDSFIKSCAAYCLVGYLFQVKDRHNGNILLDNKGHLIHIDYGFMLSSSPGKNFGFESSPFKLTQEQVQVMGGVNNESFDYYKKLILQGLLAARKHMDEICLMVEIQRKGYPKLPCFARGKATVEALRSRFLLTKTEDYLVGFVSQMVDQSLNSLTTKLYDSFQYYTNGIQ